MTLLILNLESKPQRTASAVHGHEYVNEYSSSRGSNGTGIYKTTSFWNVHFYGGFKHVLFSSLLGEDEPILTRICFRWVGTTNLNCLQFMVMNLFEYHYP